jgi:hypothetical protein
MKQPVSSFGPHSGGIDFRAYREISNDNGVCSFDISVRSMRFDGHTAGAGKRITGSCDDPCVEFRRIPIQLHQLGP